MSTHKLKSTTKKALIVMSILIGFNLIMFGLFVKLAVKFQKDNITNQHQLKQVNISVFDPVTEFFLHELSKGIKTVKIHNVNEYLGFASNISFFKKNKLKTADAVIVFDSNYKIKKYFSINDKQFFDISQNFEYGQFIKQPKDVNDFLNYGLSGTSKNLQSFLISLTYIMKNLDPNHEYQYEENFFKINNQIVDVFQRSKKILSPVTEYAVNIVLIGSQGSMFLKDVDFLGAIDMQAKIKDIQGSKIYINNLKNIINSDEITCIINLSNIKLSNIKSLSTKQKIKYLQYDLYKDFSLQNYENFANLITQCFIQ